MDLYLHFPIDLGGVVLDRMQVKIYFFNLSQLVSLNDGSREMEGWKERKGRRRNETGHASETVKMTTIIIRHQLGLDERVSVSSDSLFEGLPSRLCPFCP